MYNLYIGCNTKNLPQNRCYYIFYNETYQPALQLYEVLFDDLDIKYLTRSVDSLYASIT